MITIPEVVEKIVRKTPFLEEGLYRGIINLSALARLIKPEVEKGTMKEVKEGAILMALKRLPKTSSLGSKALEVLKKSHDLIVRSGLTEITVLNTNFSVENHKEIIEILGEERKFFLTITQGIFETTIIFSNELKKEIEKIFKKEKIISQFTNLSSITIRLPGKVVLTPGVFYSILKLLAWEGINVVEVVSTFSEFTIILEDKEVDQAFSIFKKYLYNI